MTDVASQESGSARTFPAGRLASFEDAADDSPAVEASYLGSILGPRSALQPRQLAATAAAPDSTQADLSISDSPDAAAPAVDEAATVDDERPADGSVVTQALLGGAGTIRPARQRPQRARTPRPAAEPAPADGPLDSRVRASNVHIPASFMPRIEAARKTHGLSNGELVVAALEATVDDLPGLIGAPATTGGSLFAPRNPRVVRAHEGPLTPFNIRLREADYTVIDQVKNSVGANSRGHLITVAFDAYLPTV